VLVASPSGGYFEMPFLLSLSRGYYTAEGLDVTRVQMAPPVSIAAIVSGDMDYTLAVGSAAAAIATANAPVKIVLGSAIRAIHVLMTSDPAIQSVADLRGHSIATSTLTDSSAAIVRFAVRGVGLEAQRDVALQPLGQSPNRLVAMQSGQVTAAALDLVHALDAQRGGARIIALPSDLPALPSAGLALAEPRLREQGPQIEAMARGTLRGIRHFLQNREDTIAAMMDQLGVPRDVAETTYDLGASAFTPDGIIPDASLRLLVEAAELTSGQPSLVGPEALADFSFVRRAAAQLGP
jgi:ABC-type nitrate/sulfonate/bicarbonate transport system substrate-binding protein